MLKRIMLYLMMLVTAVRFFGLTFLFSTDFERLPVMIYCSTGITVLFGIYLICKHIIKSVNKKELAVYYALIGASVIFNLIFMKVASRAELTTMDLIVIGTVMDIVFSATLIVMAVKENRYVQIRVNSHN